MEIAFTIQKGKIVEGKQKIADIITSLDDNKYIMTITSINPLISERDYQSAYFAMIDTCVRSSGNRKHVIHEAFKKEYNIETTTTLSIVEWKKVLKDFQWWSYSKMDVIC